MLYRHHFLVHAPLSQVAAFHRRSASMAEITPPPIIVRMKQAPELLSAGAELDFTMWLGPLPVRWLARIEDLSPAGFTDRQLRGPFAEWVHRHRFAGVDEHSTEIVDEVTLRLRRHPFWWLVGLAMRLGLPLLFAYRAWKTTRILNE